ncbi:hypothetical protein K7640_18690 [Micromonospora sp. PLK6-60]|uniref:hypothetical protein n=1 Tax=Micromonospora sp. PLK6-60 TaxID=2873383 RepID=UPI001CA6B89C|nr:hypothetical protein [Micromonospora sp. PLK6-60]MBY8873861.1 hypothetical protein [Micromonospora sp. PLK6-60]
MRWRLVVLGVLLCLAGPVVGLFGADGLRTGDPDRLLLVFAGLMLVVLGAGLILDARRPRRPRRSDDDSGGGVGQPPPDGGGTAGDGGAESGGGW